jgi:hypothetical protein
VLSPVTSCEVTYTPSPDYHGPDTFTFRVNDGTVNSAPAAVSITVTPVNDAPVAMDQAEEVTEDVARQIVLEASDVDGDALTCRIVTPPSHGTLSNGVDDDCNRTYTPDPDYIGADGFEWTASDGELESGTATVTLAVGAVNDAPAAIGANLETPEDTPLAVEFDVSDVDGDPLTCRIVTPPSHGTISGGVDDDCNRTYVPDQDYHGPDGFTFVASDGELESEPASITIAVASVNDAPVARDQSEVVKEEDPSGFDLAATDVDGDALACAIVAPPAHGNLSDVGDDDCNVMYTPDRDYVGPDTFTWMAGDGELASGVAIVSIDVVPVNDAPVAAGSSLETDEDTPLDVAFDVSDVDGDALTCSIAVPPVHGTLSNGVDEDCDRTYAPAPDYHGPDSLSFRVSDGKLASKVAMVRFTVHPVQDAPVAGDQALETEEDTPLAIALDASDVDGEALACEVVTGPEHGTLSAAADCIVTYTPSGDYTGPDQFTWKASDGHEDSNVATAAIEVGPVNDAPVAWPSSVRTPEDTPIEIPLGVTDVEGDALTCLVVTAPTRGTLSEVVDCRVTYTPNQDVNGPDSFTFRVSDGDLESEPASVAIAVSPVNDPPVAEATQVEIPPGVPTEITLPASDPDGEAVVCEIVSAPAHGTLSPVLTCKVTYTPVAGFRGTDAFTWRAKNGSGTSPDAVQTLLVGTGVGVEDETLPEEIALRGNYPNPFNPTTTVVFDLPEPADVTITVFDVLGRAVLRRPATPYAAGSGEVAVIDASRLPSGTYVYVVEVRGVMETRRLTGRFVVAK